MSGTSPGRYVCVHGHYYQPPRENPWLEAIEKQESAAPYHDWNERITDECYEPNASARILDGVGRIADLVNNYGRTSFDFGPTLLAWLQRERSDVYQAVLRADRKSQGRFGGHGSAMAQAYNHVILPLANRRDKRTQIRWGIHDFESRFGRAPEGMWLPETAVDLESLDLMAEEGILFTILAPHQAEAVRPMGEGTEEEAAAPEDDGGWQAVDQSSLETGRAYRVALPSGRDIAVFFYDDGTSRAVAFEQLLSDGARFAERLTALLESSSAAAPLSHIATDGESYGHHHRHGEMALAYALRSIEDRDDAELTNYGQYLELHPPLWEARIREHTSWSCSHGVERWRSDCGCAIDPGRGWTQAWRQPLRAALDWLRDTLAEPFEREAGRFAADPWEARDRYVRVVVDRSDAAVDELFEDVAGRRLEGAELTRALRLFELQRNLMLQYTSCGWFFDDLSGIETVQVLQYAGRAIHLATEVFGPDGLDVDLEEGFLARLEGATSNVPEWGNGREVYRRTVEPARVDLRKAAAHYAVSAAFDEYGEDEEIYCYRYHRRHFEEHEAGGARLLAGRVDVTSTITRNGEQLTFAVLHLGNHDLAGGVRPFAGEDGYEALLDSLRAPFRRTDFTAVLRVLDRAFEASTYSLRSLFHDAQLRIVDTLLEASVEEAEATLARLYEQRAPLLRFLADLGVPAPRPFVVAGEYVLNQRLVRILGREDPNLAAVEAILESASVAEVPLDRQAVAFEAENTLERAVLRLTGTVEDTARLARLRGLVRILREGDIPLDLWRVQNAFFRLVRDIGPLAESATAADVPPAASRDREGPRHDPAEWRVEVERLGETLHVVVR